MNILYNTTNNNLGLMNLDTKSTLFNYNYSGELYGYGIIDRNVYLYDSDKFTIFNIVNKSIIKEFDARAYKNFILGENVFYSIYERHNDYIITTYDKNGLTIAQDNFIHDVIFIK